MKYIRIEGDVAYVELTRDREALIDATDVDRVRPYSWSASPNKMGGFYAKATVNGKTTYLHRLILNAQPGEVVDHRNHDTLDNRRVNIVACTHQENCQNQDDAHHDSATGVLGVFPWRMTQRRNGREYRYTYYKAEVRRNGKRISRIFPLTPEGLAQATAYVELLREEAH